MDLHLGIFGRIRSDLVKAASRGGPILWSQSMKICKFGENSYFCCKSYIILCIYLKHFCSDQSDEFTDSVDENEPGKSRRQTEEDSWRKQKSRKQVGVEIIDHLFGPRLLVCLFVCPFWFSACTFDFSWEFHLHLSNALKQIFLNFLSWTNWRIGGGTEPSMVLLIDNGLFPWPSACRMPICRNNVRKNVEVKAFERWGYHQLAKRIMGSKI